MPRSRSLSAYPLPTLVALIDKARVEAVVVPTADAKASASLRHNLYAFRRAAEADPQGATAAGVDLETLRDIYIQIVPEGLRVARMDEHPMAKALASVVGPVARPRTVADEASESLARLMAKIEGGGNGQ